MNNVDLKEYLPICYEGIIETEAEQDALSIELNRFNATCEEAMNDQFIQNCSLKAITYYEDTFHIIADPTTESLEFRKQRILSRMKSLRPPYTYWYLRILLDNFFGVGNYDLDVDNDNYLITLESSADNSLWYHEIQVSMTLIKPCNMVFKNKARITTNLVTNETVKTSQSIRNYKLNGDWKLGLRPFISIIGEEINKMPQVASVNSYFITKSLEDWMDLFDNVLINNSYNVTNINISVENSSLILSYEVSHEDVSNITNIKLRDSQDLTLFNSNVYIPIDDYAIIKHIIMDLI